MPVKSNRGEFANEPVNPISNTLNPDHPPVTPTIILQTERPAGNGLGTARFVLSLIAVFLGWVPFLGWLVWVLGLILSFVGVFRKPRGLAIVGLVISLIGIILLIFVFGAILAAATLGR